MALFTRDTAETRDLAATPNANPGVAGWAVDLKSLMIFEANRTRNALYRLPLDGPLETVCAPRIGVLGNVRMNASKTHFGFPVHRLDQPVEALVLAWGGTPVQVSAANRGLELSPVAKSEVVSWKGKDGLTIEGILTYPANYAAGVKAPLILNIHGGLSGVFSESFIGAGRLYPIATKPEKINSIPSRIQKAGESGLEWFGLPGQHAGSEQGDRDGGWRMRRRCA